MTGDRAREQGDWTLAGPVRRSRLYPTKEERDAAISACWRDLLLASNAYRFPTLPIGTVLDDWGEGALQAEMDDRGC